MINIHHWINYIEKKDYVEKQLSDMQMNTFCIISLQSNWRRWIQRKSFTFMFFFSMFFYQCSVQFVFLHFCTNSMVLDTANSLCLDWHIKRRGTPWTLYLAMTQVPYRPNLTGNNPKLLSSIRPRESTIHIALFFKLNISCTRH